MSLYLGSSFNRAADWACHAPIIQTVFGNPVFTALLITAIAAIVVLAIYHRELKKCGTKRAVKALIYLGFVVMMVMFVHHYATNRIARDAINQRGVRDVFSSIDVSRAVGDPHAVPVYPMGFEPAQPRFGGAAFADDAAFADGAAFADDACGCGVAQPRPDNVAIDNGELVIQDVTLPATQI